MLKKTKLGAEAREREEMKEKKISWKRAELLPLSLSLSSTKKASPETVNAGSRTAPKRGAPCRHSGSNRNVKQQPRALDCCCFIIHIMMIQFGCWTTL
jgi:hypothetical protein